MYVVLQYKRMTSEKNGQPTPQTSHSIEKEATNRCFQQQCTLVLRAPVSVHTSFILSWYSERSRETHDRGFEVTEDSIILGLLEQVRSVISKRRQQFLLDAALLRTEITECGTELRPGCSC